MAALRQNLPFTSPLRGGRNAPLAGRSTCKSNNDTLCQQRGRQLRTRILAVVGLLALPCAQAQQPPSNLNANSPPRASVHPAPNTCDSFYPAPALAEKLDRTTALSVHVTANGELHDGKLLHSSGNADLDLAAVSCVNDLHILPVTQNGLPVAIDWIIQINWGHDGHSSFTTPDPVTGKGHLCLVDYPPMAVRLGEQGTTIVTFRIAKDGTVGNLIVARSSGFADLDNATLACVSQFHYYPPTKDGQPIEIDYRAGVPWRMTR